ncbi:MAG: TonB-dependent receptor [Alloprevotella sp.]|nr:TonB-dependent receptor [Alloprevotella sp.]
MNSITKTFFSFLLCVAPLAAPAQHFGVQGRIVDADSVAVALVRVGLFGADSTRAVATAETQVDGSFSLAAPRAGSYRLEASLIGYRPVRESVKLTAQSPRKDFGTIVLESLDRELGEAQVTALSQQLTIEADTFSYHTDAFRLPPGATLGALMKQLPGLEMDADGNLTFQGRSVSNILVNGKPFFQNAQEAMANVTAEAVKDVRLYEKTDETKEFTRTTDADKQTVMDLRIKKEYMGNWSANLDAGGGTHERYILKGFGTNFTERRRLSLYAQVNNISENQQADENGNWSNWTRGDGLYTYRSLGANYSWENGRKNTEGGRVEVTASGNLRHNNRSRLVVQHNEEFLPGGGALRSESLTHSWTRLFDGQGRAHLVWNVDTLRRLTLSAGFSTSRYPAIKHDTASASSPAGAVYEQLNLGHGLYRDTSGSANLSYIRRLRREGQSLELSANFDFGESRERRHEFAQQRYFQPGVPEPLNVDRQYELVPTHNQNLTIDANYNFRLSKHFEGRMGYRYGYWHTTTARHLYDLDIYEAYRSLSLPLGTLPTQGDSLLAARNFENAFGRSRYSLVNGIVPTLRGRWDKVDFDASVQTSYVSEHLYYDRAGQHLTPSRHYVSVWPRAVVNWKFVESGKLTFSYEGGPSYAGLEDKLPFTDNSNTLRHEENNPDLHTAWWNRVFLRGNYFDKKHGTNFSAFAGAQQTLNKVVPTQRVDAVTGVRTLSETNVNGTWNAWGYLNTELRLDSAQHWKLRLSTSFDVSREKSFVGEAAGGLGLSLLHNYAVRPGAFLSWRDKIWTVSFNASYGFLATRYQQTPQYNQTGQHFEARLAPQVDLPFGMKLSTSLHYYVNWNYADALMNHAQWLWNISASQSFLKDKRLTVQLEVQDLLHQRTAENSTLSGTARHYNRTHVFLSYAMLHLVYRFSIGGRSAVQQSAPGPRVIREGGQVILM